MYEYLQFVHANACLPRFFRGHVDWASKPFQSHEIITRDFVPMPPWSTTWKTVELRCWILANARAAEESSMPHLPI
jgi:hypothetical protein